MSSISKSAVTLWDLPNELEQGADPISLRDGVLAGGPDGRRTGVTPTEPSALCWALRHFNSTAELECAIRNLLRARRLDSWFATHKRPKTHTRQER
jgi:hypothetical protein